MDGRKGLTRPLFQLVLDEILQTAAVQKTPEGAISEPGPSKPLPRANVLNTNLNMMSSNNENVPEAAAEGRYSGVAVGAATVGTSTVTPCVRCPECNQLCKSQRGLALHRRRAHGKVPAPQALTKRRWTDTELYQLALEEIQIRDNLPAGLGLNQALHQKFPNRTVGSIKAQRRTALPRYQQALQDAERFMARRQGAPSVLSLEQVSRESEGMGIDLPEVSTELTAGDSAVGGETSQSVEAESANVQLGEDPERRAWRSRLEESISASGIHLPGQCVEAILDPQKSKAEVRELVSAAYDAWIPARESRPRAAPGTRSNRGIGRPKPTKRALRRQNFARLQRLFKRSRKRAAAAVLDNSWESLADDLPGVSLTDQEEFWKPLFEAPSQPDPRQPDCHEVNWDLAKPVSSEEVRRVIYGPKGMKDGAPGPDGLKLRDLKRFETDKIAVHFNLWMLAGSPPDRLSEAVTILIPKELGATEPAKHRPITISSIVLRCFHSVMARRMTDGLPWAPCQRAFVPGDGVAESTLLIQQILSRARKKLKATHLAFVDIRKAFDSVSHETMLKAARRMGVPDPFLEYLGAYYERATTRLKVRGTLGVLIRLGRGVRQGCPLSGLLFNAVVDWVLSNLDPNLGMPLEAGPVGDDTRRIRCIGAAFADDLTLCGETKEGLQAQCDNLTAQFRAAGLEISAGPNGKTTSLSIEVDGKAKRWSCVSEPWLQVNGDVVPTIPLDGVQKYLGIQFSAYGCRVDVVKELEEGLENIRKAPLRPQQKLYVLTQHLIASLSHQLVLAPASAKYLEHLDRLVRKAVRGWLRMPKDTPLEAFYARTMDGGIGIPLLAKRIPILRSKRFTKMSESQTKDPVFAFLLRGYQPPPPPKFNGVAVADMRTLNEAVAENLTDRVDGRGLRPAPYVKAQHDWVNSATELVKGRSFISCLKLRLGVVSTPERNSRGRPEMDSRCDCCGRTCGVSHILQSCPRTDGSRRARHDRLKGRLAHAARKRGWTVLSEQTIPVPDAHSKRPDLILAKNGHPVYVVDVTVVSDRWEDLESAYRHKCNYYNTEVVRSFVSSRFPGAQVKHQAVAMSWRGLIHPESARLCCEALGLSKRWLSIFSLVVLEKGTSILVHWSRSTYRVTH